MLHIIVQTFQGLPRLRNILCRLYGREMHRTLNPDTEVLVTCGAYEALYCSISGLVDTGDEVIIIEPFFDCYEPMTLVAGGIVRFIPLRRVSFYEAPRFAKILSMLIINNLRHFNSILYRQDPDFRRPTGNWTRTNYAACSMRKRKLLS